MAMGTNEAPGKAMLLRVGLVIWLKNSMRLKTQKRR